jgi:RNA polymerase subunit RPABC4/transcription elongation factor Spt4
MDVMLERYTHDQAKEWFGVIITTDGEVDITATREQRKQSATHL